jgi:hypothetical protein
MLRLSCPGTLHQQTSGARLETSPADRQGVKILISDFKFEPFSKKKKIQKLKMRFQL